MADDFDTRFVLVLNVLNAQSAHLLAVDAKLDKATILLGHIVEQLQHMNEGLIRTLTVRTELDELRARVAALESRNGR